MALTAAQGVFRAASGRLPPRTTRHAATRVRRLGPVIPKPFAPLGFTQDMDLITPSRTAYRRAPNQRGGPAWKGPRERLVTRIDLTSAAMIRTRANLVGVHLLGHRPEAEDHYVCH